MKKIMFMLVAATVAVTASASNVKWGLQSGQSLSTISSGTMYLVYGAVPSTDWSAKTSYSASDLTGVVAADGIVSSGAYTDTTGVSITPSDIGVSGNGMKSFYAAIISDDGKSIAISTAKNINIASSTMSVQAMWTAANFTTYTPSSSGGGGGEGGGVPEPTSGLLLLVGGAMLALRRKQK